MELGIKKITLPSGKILEISDVPFSVANSLNKAIAKELKMIKIDPNIDVGDINFIKDIACHVVSSDEIMSCLSCCMERCLYGGEKITDSSFEKIENRQDYFPICKEIMHEVLLPFVKSLLSQFGASSSEKKA